MAKKNKQQKSIKSILKSPKDMSFQQMNKNNLRKNNMNYTNINKNRGK